MHQRVRDVPDDMHVVVAASFHAVIAVATVHSAANVNAPAAIPGANSAAIAGGRVRRAPTAGADKPSPVSTDVFTVAASTTEEQRRRIAVDPSGSIALLVESVLLLLPLREHQELLRRVERLHRDDLSVPARRHLFEVTMRV